MEVGLVGLLRAAWIAGTLPILIASVPSSMLNWFRDALLGFAKRGKTMQSSSQVRDSLVQLECDWFLISLGVFSSLGKERKLNENFVISVSVFGFRIRSHHLELVVLLVQQKRTIEFS